MRYGKEAPLQSLFCFRLVWFLRGKTDKQYSLIIVDSKSKQVIIFSAGRRKLKRTLFRLKFAKLCWCFFKQWTHELTLLLWFITVKYFPSDAYIFWDRTREWKASRCPPPLSSVEYISSSRSQGTTRTDWMNFCRCIRKFVFRLERMSCYLPSLWTLEMEPTRITEKTYLRAERPLLHGK